MPGCPNYTTLQDDAQGCQVGMGLARRGAARCPNMQCMHKDNKDKSRRQEPSGKHLATM